MEKVLYTITAHNVGQVKIEDAYDEIMRLNALGQGRWKKDFSPLMYVSDDPDIKKPFRLMKGHCWIVKY